MFQGPTKFSPLLSHSILSSPSSSQPYFRICDALAGRSSYGSHLLFGLMVLRRRVPVICYLHQQNISLVPCVMPQILFRNHSLYDPRIFLALLSLARKG